MNPHQLPSHLTYGITSKDNAQKLAEDLGMTCRQYEWSEGWHGKNRWGVSTGGPVRLLDLSKNESGFPVLFTGWLRGRWYQDGLETLKSLN